MSHQTDGWGSHIPSIELMVGVLTFQSVVVLGMAMKTDLDIS